MTSEERDAQLAAYALGSLSGPEANAVEELARSDPAAARQLAEYQEVADLIALDAPLQRADPALRARVLRAARQADRPGRRVPGLRARPWGRWHRAPGARGCGVPARRPCPRPRSP